MRNAPLLPAPQSPLAGATTSRGWTAGLFVAPDHASVGGAQHTEGKALEYKLKKF